MAALSDPDRATLATDYQRTFETGESIDALKADVRTLVNDLDAYLDANAVAINLAISASVRSKFTARQKARAMVFVIRRRFEVT